MPSIRLAVTALAGLLAAANIALAGDTPILGGRLQLRTAPSGKQKLVFRSNDSSIGTDDPLTQGLVVELFAPGQTSASMTAPAMGADPGWTYLRGTFKFKRGKTPSTVTPIKKIIIKPGEKIMLTADAAGLAMTAPLGQAGIRLQVGTVRICAAFADAAVVQDTTGKFSGKNAPRPADCSATTLTGQPPTCGDNVVSPPETCDGTDLSACAPFGFECRLPGVAGECTCCSNGGAFANYVGCCNPSARLIVLGSTSANCVATRCDPPYPCSGGDVCQPDGSCCAPLGGQCQLDYPISAALSPCCPGLQCEAPATDGSSFWRTCCAPETGACTTNADCCTRHCQGDGTCGPCGAAGTACTTLLDCCSRSCNAATAQCDP